MKTSKKIISVLMCVVMMLSTFAGLGFEIDFATIEAEAATRDDVLDDDGNIVLGEITQKRVITDYASTYRDYQERFFTGADSNEPTDFVIPGLSSTDDYTPQGMTYWEAKEWILISAYHAGGSNPSVIYALDAKTTDMVAVFKLYNQDGSVNKSHGGGIAASEYNFYYADSGSKISYVPLSEMDVEPYTTKNITLRGSIDCASELNGVATSYCCYEDGVLWAGNFYWSGDDRYNKKWHDSYPSVLIGYRLKGNSSAEEWANLQNTNLIKPREATNASGSAMTYTAKGDDKGYIDISAVGTGTAGETVATVGDVYLVHGKEYVLEYDFDSNTTNYDLYLLKDGDTDCYTDFVDDNRNPVNATITDNDNGTKHCKISFTAGADLPTLDGNWGNGTDSTGNYHFRFDQDFVTSDKTLNLTNIRIREADKNNDGKDRAGNPTYVVPFNNDLDRLQYAMVYKGKIYLSRSWSRNDTGNHIRELCIGDFDINIPGATDLTINGRLRGCSVVEYDAVTKFGGDPGNTDKTKMFFMSEALCIIEDYLYMFSEGAAWAYYGKDGTEDGDLCDEPIDVIWKIDQYELLGENRGIGSMEQAIHYEKVQNLSDINSTDEYIIVHQSRESDPVTQKPYLYLLDSYGGYGGKKLPKSNASSQKLLGDSMGVIGYPISNYTAETVDGIEQIIISEEDSLKESIHWNFEGVNQTDGTPFRISNKDSYFANNPYLYFGSRTFAMSNNNRGGLDNVHIEQYDEDNTNGDFRLYFNSAAANPKYYLWCNDGADPELIDAYTDYYANHPHNDYDPNYEDLEEIPGTFHADAKFAKGDLADSGNITGEAFGSVDNQILHIYRRVKDPYGSVAESRVYTDMDAVLQADGTYQINLETYATAPYVYTKLPNKRPTDYIFVVDNAEYDMEATDASGYELWDKDYGKGDGVSITDLSGMDDGDLCKSDGKNWQQNASGAHNGIYFRTDDGTYCPIYVDARTGERSGSIVSRKWVTYVKIYYIHNNVKYYYQKNTGTFTTTSTEISSGSQGSTADRAKNLKDSDCGDRKFNFPHYVKKSGDLTRINAARGLIEDLSTKLAADNPDHRIAVVTYGSDNTEGWLNTGVYSSSGTAYNNSFVQYSGDGTITNKQYASALFTSDKFQLLRECVNFNMVDASNGVRYGDDKHDPDTYSQYGMEIANKILENSGTTYDAKGDRSACIFFISTSAPGNDSNNKAEIRRTVDETIAKARTTKIDHGAYIYSIQFGTLAAGKFDKMDSYLQYVSSIYTDAQDMNHTGDKNTDDIDYKLDVPTGTTDYDQTAMVTKIINSVNTNSTNALSKIKSDAVLKEKLSSAFTIPTDGTASVSVKTAVAHYDGIGRVYFDTPAEDKSLTTTEDLSNKQVTVSGFDYMKNYIGKSNDGNGKKLIVTISGVLVDNAAKLNNTSINDTTKTAIYESSAADAPQSKRFPTAHFDIPEYTYALDFGMSMKDTDINGTPLAVAESPSKLNTANNYSAHKTTETGIMRLDIQNNNSLIYSLVGTEGEEADARRFVFAKRPDGSYDWFRINIVPASNVLYDTSSITYANDTSKTSNWNAKGERKAPYLSVDTSSLHIYGYNSALKAEKYEHLNDAHIEAKVSASNKRSDTASFTYVGQGFDLIGSCGPDTGVQVVNIKSGGKTVKAYIVDTYYNDTTYGTLSQTPILTYLPEGSPDEYVSYTVEVTAAYLSSAGALQTAAADGEAAPVDYSDPDSIFAELGMDELIGTDAEIKWFDEDSVLNGGMGAEGNLSTQADGVTELTNCIDGYRVYKPLTDADANIFYSTREKHANFHNIIDKLSGSDGFFAYVAGASGKYSFADYIKGNQAQNEVYLEPGTNASDALVFSFDAQAADNYRVMLSMRSADGKPVNVKVNDYSFTVESTTEMFYDITNYAAPVGGVHTITVSNQGQGLLAIGKAKVTNADLTQTTAAQLADVVSLMLCDAVPVEANGAAATTPLTNFPAYVPDPVIPGAGTDDEDDVPSNPGTSTDPDTPTEPDEPVDDSTALEKFFARVEYIFNAVISFFKAAFNIIVGAFKKI